MSHDDRVRFSVVIQHQTSSDIVQFHLYWLTFSYSITYSIPETDVRLLYWHWSTETCSERPIRRVSGAVLASRSCSSPAAGGDDVLRRVFEVFSAQKSRPCAACSFALKNCLMLLILHGKYEQNFSVAIMLNLINFSCLNKFLMFFVFVMVQKQKSISCIKKFCCKLLLNILKTVLLQKCTKTWKIETKHNSFV